MLKDFGVYDEEQLKSVVRNKLQEIYSINKNEGGLELSSVEFGTPNYNPDSWKDLKAAKLKKDTVGIPYHGTFRLKDREGNVIEEKKMRLGLLPIATKLDAFMVDGNYYTIPTQFRLRPGSYARETQKGDYEIFSNFANSAPFRTIINPETKEISIKYRQGSFPLYPVLKALGVDDRAIYDKLGNEIYQKISKADVKKGIVKAYTALYGKAPASIDEAKDGLIIKFSSIETDPDVNRKTLGYDFKNPNGDYWLRTASKLANIMRGEESVDNRDSLEFKKVFGIPELVEDHLERARKTFKLTGKANWNLGKAPIDKLISKSDIDKEVRQFFTSSTISRFTDTVNPIAIKNQASLTTLLGEGGVKSTDVVTGEAKTLQNSHLGFLDIVHTPESGSAGVTLFLTKGAKKIGKDLCTKVINLKTGQEEYRAVKDLMEKGVAFPKEYSKTDKGYAPSSGNRVRIIKNDKRAVVNPDEVEYMISSPMNMYDVAANSVPFLHSNQGNRQLTSSKMVTQALPLANPEKPLVEVIEDDDTNFLDNIGRDYSVAAERDGVITKIENGEIHVNHGGLTKIYEYPVNMPMNGDTFLDGKPLFNVGDKVKKGQTLVDTNFTKDGKMSNGINLNVAYIPWKGMNYEDAVVISENAAKKLSSIHLHKISIPLENKLIDFKKYQAIKPYAISKEDLEKFDEDGIVKVGQKIFNGDIIGGLVKHTQPSPIDNIVSKIRKSALPTYREDTIMWEYNNPGEVTEVSRTKDSIDIYVKTIEPCEVGDKLVGRHGNKATISYIIPEEMTPLTESGEKIDIIMDSSGVHPRINLGQLIETAAGKLAAKKGETFKVKNFSGEDYRTNILNEMNRLRIKEKEAIYDPETGKTIKDIMTGKQYIYKLMHQVEKKMSARGIDDPYTTNNTPTRGGGAGGMSVDNLTMNCLLSHNARNFLRESFSIKNNPSREYWRAIMSGNTPPAPKFPYEFEKFEGLLKGMGINTEHSGSKIKITPLTDEHVLKLSAGPIKTPYKMFIGKGESLSPDKDGLFGDVTGGIGGNKFNHIELEDRIPSPAYKDSIKTLLEISDNEFNDLLSK